MRKNYIDNLIYKFVSYVIVFPIFRIVFRGTIVGSENIPKEDSFILVSNHGSLLDPPFLGHALGLKVSFMAKAELFRIPILSKVIIACGAYPVKRGITDKNSIRTAIDKLDDFNIVGIFIDGTRQKDGRVNNPKKGAALISAKTKKILLPIAIINSHRLLRFVGFVPIFNKVIIKIGKPINYPNSSSKEDLNLATYKIQENINKLIDCN
ncbi:MAG: 1-acyl-sn-glycerol-3-phosphate acyltransferase [Prochlorococcus sp. SP3034]|nr:1-acyl-sn-glycerol-3-phosphate acyltransferase [Prochlorococcus sp. SP3034]|tara:strand:- start:14731 stop:15357 length:627 start_codon:yes stop_codon:yes gene_type:complete